MMVHTFYLQKAKINLQLPEVRRGRIFPHTKTIPSLNQLQASSAAFEFDPETTKQNGQIITRFLCLYH